MNLTKEGICDIVQMSEQRNESQWMYTVIIVPDLLMPQCLGGAGPYINNVNNDIRCFINFKLKSTQIVSFSPSCKVCYERFANVNTILILEAGILNGLLIFPQIINCRIS